MKNFLILGVLILSSLAESQTTRIEIKMTAEERIALSKPRRTDIPWAVADIYENGEFKQHAEVSLHSRGQTSLKKFLRKNLEVKPLNKEDKKLKTGDIKSKEMILSASPADMLVTKNMLVYRLYELFEIPTLKTDYTEVVINNESQGLYMASKSPKEHLMDEDADIVYRRRYNDVMELEKADKKLSDAEIVQYKSYLKGIYKDLKKLEGQALVDSLSEKMNLDGYLKWLALNYLVHNGDYVDEIFFFGKKKENGQMYFNILPWDLDDTFADKMHMQKFPLTSNFGRQQRSKDQMLFGFESRIDQAVSEDPVLLNRYFKVLEEISTKLTEEELNKIFAQVEEKLHPYLNNEAILKNGLLDAQKHAHTKASVQAHFQAKKDFIKQQLKDIKAELEVIKKEKPGERARRLHHKKVGLFLQSLFYLFTK